jgi:hypothetical protein
MSRNLQFVAIPKIPEFIHVFSILPNASLVRHHLRYFYLIFYLLAQAILLAQQTSTFGITTELKSVRRARGLLAGDFNGDGITDIATFSDQQVSVYYQEKEIGAFKNSFASLSSGIISAAIGDFNNDKYSDIVTLSDHSPELHVYLAKPGGLFSSRWTTTLPGKYDRIVLGDINNDGKLDIILYTRKEPGLEVYLGTGGGSFKKPQLLFPDIAFSTVKIVDMNDDKVKDVVGVNWITNEVNIFSNYGRLKFGNPVVITFDHEPTFLVPAHLHSAIIMDLIVGFADQRSLHTYFGDGMGNFNLSQSLTLDANPSDILTFDASGSGKDDIAILNRDEKSLDIWLNDSRGSFEDPVDFAAGKTPAQIVSFPDYNSHGVNVAILDSSSSKVRVLYNSSAHHASAKELDYCLGSNPVGITIADFNHDSWPDLIVSNTGSQNFAIFKNRKDGTYDGQVVFPVSMNPTGVNYFSKNDSIGVVLLTGRYEDNISVNEINVRKYTRTSYSISTQQNPLILAELKQAQSLLFDVFALEFERTSQRYSLTKFEQIARKRFIEKNYTPSANLAGACVLNGVNGQQGNIVYIQFDKRNRTLMAFRSEATDQKKNGNAKYLFSISSEEHPKVSMWGADINNDGIEDLIINLQDPDNALFTSLGKKDLSFSPPQKHFSDAISVSRHDRLKVIDINGDNIKDLVLENDLDKSIQAFLGKGDGTFSSKIRLTSTVGLGGFEVCNINNDATTELILVDTVDGLLKIIPLNQ